MIEQPGGSAVHGVWTERWSRLLEGEGWAVGAKFRPGAFEPFTRIAMADLTDTARELGDVFGPAASELEHDVIAASGDEQRVRVVEEFRARRPPGPDPDTRHRNADRRLDAGRARRHPRRGRRGQHGLSARSMQRCFGAISA